MKTIKLQQVEHNIKIGKDSLIEYDAILNMFNQKGIEGDKYISCDVARFGADKTVIMLS